MLWMSASPRVSALHCLAGLIRLTDHHLARENQDTACLNFALSWLLYLRQSKPNNRTAAFGSISGLLGGATGEQDEIAFLKSKARETKHWSLLSSTLLEEAKLDMYLVCQPQRNVDIHSAPS